MAYQYNINNAKADKRSEKCLFWCHNIFNMTGIFISTFLVAHIYSFAGDVYDYIFKVCSYYFAEYITMLIFYFLIAKLVEKTNRVSIFRISLIIRTCLLVLYVFYGKDIAQILLLAGFIKGFSDACYYSSYNVLKQELVSRKSIGKYSANIYVAAKIIDIICPITLGTLIDISTYSTVAILICVICFIQIGVSMFIKSQKPENSKLDMRGFFKAIKKDPETYKQLKFIYLICILYNATIISAVLNICIMIEFESSFSLGLITSVLAIVSVATIFIVRKFTRPTNRMWLFIASAIFLTTASLLLGFFPSKWSVVVYHSAIAVGAIIFKIYFDAYRNGILKEAGLYSEIAEHHTFMETIFSIVRAFCFLLAILVALSQKLFLFNAYLILVSMLYSAAFICLGIYERRYIANKPAPQTTSSSTPQN